MSNDRQRDEELKGQFWEALADSPYLFLQLDSDPEIGRASCRERV